MQYLVFYVSSVQNQNRFYDLKQNSPKSLHLGFRFSGFFTQDTAADSVVGFHLWHVYAQDCLNSSACGKAGKL